MKLAVRLTLTRKLTLIKLAACSTHTQKLTLQSFETISRWWNNFYLHKLRPFPVSPTATRWRHSTHMRLRTTTATAAELFDGSQRPSSIDTGLAAPEQIQRAFNILGWTAGKVSEKQMPLVCISSRDVKVSRPVWSRDHFFGLGITVIGLGLGLMKYWSRSHTLWSHGLKSIICSRAMTSRRSYSTARRQKGQRHSEQRKTGQ